jgi:hypothetical protein
MVTAALLVGLALPACAFGQGAVTEVRVERERPPKEKIETLRFLKDNRDFIRARFDLLKQVALQKRGEAAAIDPRFLGYQSMLAEIMGARDSVALAEDARKKLDLLRSITDLGRLENQLDLLDRQLDGQRNRLARLQADFTGRQRTALVVVLSGSPQGEAPRTVAITLDDGTTVSDTLSAEQQQALKQGGVVQIFHGFVEPRAQVIQVAMSGGGWSPGDAGFVTLDPPRDRFSFLRFDLSSANPARGAASLRATTWLNDAKQGAGDS